MKTDRLLIIFAALMLFVNCNDAPLGHSPYEKEISQRLVEMSLEEKAGQLVQLNIDKICDPNTLELMPDAMEEIFGRYKIGSILNTMGENCPDQEWMRNVMEQIQKYSIKGCGIPCIYGLDMIHGASYLAEGTLFPQEINLGATFNPEHAENMGKVLAYETRSMDVRWVFSPVMDLGRNPVWPRQWESWGEDAYLQTVMSETETRAIQGEDRDNIGMNNTAACIKHYLGYGVPVTGKDRTPAIIPDYELRERYFRPFEACIKAGALSLMVNSASINGIPTHANHKLLTEWVKEDLDWDGLIVTDWADIDNLYERDHVAADRKEAIAMGINAGVDMIMDPYKPEITEDICDLVREGIISEERLNDAVARVLRLKYRLGLFTNPTMDSDRPFVGSDEFARLAYDAAVESQVLLKNNGILPLRKDMKILVTGPNGNSMRCLNGGWSYTWQGTNNPRYVEKYNTIFEAVKAKFPSTRYAAGVSYIEDWAGQDEDASGILDAVSAARDCDVILACIGENSYCETPGNINDLTISANQRNLVKALAKTGKPIILILNEGRPRVINEIEPIADAVVDILLPGNYGGDALAALLCGDENFSGKLPFTYPKYVNSLHTYDFKVSEKREMIDGAYNYDAKMDVQWSFGDGLSYTTFRYSDLSVDKSTFRKGDSIRFSVNVTNIGPCAGKESVLLYSSDLVASMIPDVKRLRAFDKISLSPGETKTVEFTLDSADLAFAGDDGQWHLEPGEFRISIGTESAIICCIE
ncbi:MAG: glycoside hydrolase family 3 C-terminal domain-containing protein [Bacteroidales bacterium]|nr:glycoside hydrolase family 3 C-terminal domain-containing protein [Bacteroidales bacterium]